MNAGRVLLALLLLTLGLAVIVPAQAATANLALAETAPATVLYGTPASVTLTASNPSTSPATPMYNVSYEDVQPVGASYVAGSSTLNNSGTTGAISDPTVLANQPSTGKTTLIWSNVGDLQPSATQALTFKIQGQTDSGTHVGPDPILPGSSYTDAAGVYANSNPRYVPQFDPTTGAPVTGSTSYTDSANASGTTAITPLAISKSEPSPESELPRGVHDHQVVYTVTVDNNDVHATNAISVTDWLPAGLEFLGCGGIDNTSDASGTNPGSTEEYPGSGSLVVGAPLSSSSCPTPTSVTTVLDPSTPNGALTGVYTEVTWSLGNLAASGVDTFEYKAGIPLRENTMTWSGTTPSAASDDQAANLDNNNGTETHDGESLTNVVAATGTYSGSMASGATNPVAAEGQDTVEAVDLAVQKTVGNPTFQAGEVVDYTLHYETSEYRYTTGAVLTDHVPSGLCPLGPTNYATDSDAAECAPQSGQEPSTPYSTTSPPTEQSDGSFLLTWDLGTLPPNTDLTITYPLLDRAYYQATSGGTLGPSTPTLIGDSLTNTTTISGTVNGTCYDGTSTDPTADPTCSGTNPTVIYSGEATPAASSNGSQAEQSASEPTVIKRVSQAVAPGGTLNCATATYLTSASSDYPPTYEAGDTICFQLEVDFPAGVYSHDAEVTDFLPPNAAYVPGSEVAATGNTATIASVTDAGTSPDSVAFALGNTLGSDPGLYVAPGQTFVADLAVTAIQPPDVGNAFTLTDNLMKFTALNTDGQSVSLRSQASYNLSQPVLALSKSVALVNGAAPGSTVQDGDQVTYDVTLTNTGLEPATNTTVWDNLPSQVTDCSTSIASISNSGTCGTATQLQWTGVTVPAAGSGGPGTTTLSYVMTVPTGVAAGETLTNQAGVVSYQPPAPNNGGTSNPATYVPADNIDPLSPPSNAPAANGSASVVLASPTLVKTAAPTINGPNSATIGEPIEYTLTTVVPAGTSLYSATLNDPLGSDLTYSTTPAPVSGTVQFGTGDVLPLPTSFHFTTTGNAVHLAFPPTFGTAPGTPATFVVTFYATVADVAANSAGSTIVNTGTFAWNSSTGAPSSTTSSATTTVVEPHLGLTKTDGLNGGPYAPGATVTYTVTLSNTGSNVSAAHDVVVTDTLPTAETSPACGTAPTGWTCSTAVAGTVTWTLSTADAVNPNAPAVFTYTAVLPDPAIGSSTLTNNVAVTANSLDLTTYPGARTTYTATGQDTVDMQGPSVAKVADPTSVTNGVDTTYTATITVPAGLQFPGLTAIDTLPDGMTFDAYGSNASYTCSDDVGGVVGSCGSDVVTQSVGTPVKAANGTTPLAWYIGNLNDDPGVRTITVNYTAYPAKIYHTGTAVTPTTLDNAIGLYWNDTASSGPPTTVPTAGSFTHATATTFAPLAVIAPTLAVTKTASTSAPVPGTPLTYTITVTNNGSATAYDPVVSDIIPAALNREETSIVTGPSSPSQGTAIYMPLTGMVSWNMTGTTLAVGASATLTVQTELGPSSGLTNGQSITNTATVSQYYGVPEATATGDPSRYFGYGPVNGSITVHPVFPTFAVTKTTPHGTAATVGTPFSWQLVTTDTTAAPASNVTITDTLPAYWIYTPTGQPGANATTITLADGTIVSGADADPVVSLNPATHVETLSWPGLGLGALGGVTNTSSITISYTATPGQGVTHTNTNTAYADGDDATGASGNSSGAYQSPTATATAIIPTADLQITKTIGPNGLVAGGPSNVYDIAVKNNGPDSAAAPIVVNDTAPAGTSFTGGTGAGWICSLAGGGTSISCTLSAALASGASAATLAAAIYIPSSYTGPISNTATVTSPTNDPDPANNISTVVGTVSTEADLSIVKSHTGDFTAGTTGTYQLAVTNNGPSDSPGPITVTDSIPDGETYQSASGTGWVCAYSAPTVTCTLAAGLTSGSASAITLNVTVAADQAPEQVTNTATVSGPLTDPDPGNNTSSDPTNLVSSADLTIEKTHADTDTFGPGTDIHYSLAVDNAGPSDAVTPTVSDTLPSYETFVSASGTGWECDVTGQVVVCNAVGNLPANSSAGVITLVVELSPSFLGGDVINTATVGSTTSDPVPGNNTSTDTSASGTAYAHLTIVKSHTGDFTAGSAGTYSFAVTNSGPSDAAGPVTVTDTLPAGESYASSAGTGWTCGAVGQIVTCQLAGGLADDATNSALTVTVNVASDVPPGVITNTAGVSSPTPNPDPTGSTANDPTTIVTSADLSIVKSHTGDFVPGTDASYTLQVANAGPSDAAGPVLVTDALPAGETYVSGSGTGWSCSASGQNVVCQLAAGLTAGTESSPQPASPITLTVAIDSGYAGATLSNTADVSSTTSDPNPGNNSSTDVADVSPEAHLTVLKTSTATPVAGSPFSYQITVTNNGPSDNTGPIIVTDPLPVGETFTSAGGTGWSCVDTNEVTCSLGAGLVAGTTSTSTPITLTVAIDPSLPPGPLSNTATVTSGGTPDPDPGATSTDTVTLTTSADLSIAKTHTGNFTPGQNASYDLQVDNAGPSDAAGPVTVTDTLPAGETFVSAVGTGWLCTATGQDINCQLATELTAGMPGSPQPAPPFSLTVAVGGAAYPTVSNTASVSSPTSDPDPANNSSTNVATVNAVADLSIVKTHTGTAVAGADLTYTLAVGNLGPTADPGPVTVTDPLPDGESFVSGTGTGWSCTDAGQVVTCVSAGAVPVGYTGSISLVVLLGEASLPTVVNTATITGKATDPDPANNTSTNAATVTPGATLSITKKLDSSSLVTGQTAAYTVTVNSLGPSPAAGVAVTDHLPTGLVPVSASGTGWACVISGQEVDCGYQSALASGASSSIAIAATVTATSGTLANAATFSAQTQLVGQSTTSATTPPVAVTPLVEAAAGSADPGDGSGPTGSLAVTGLDLLLLAGIGLALVLSGTVLVLVDRRRGRTS
jgi:uncharacterized repeat protein (TIGR01451 family)/fimbrial isopeptide formation D2 family protein